VQNHLEGHWHEACQEEDCLPQVVEGSHSVKSFGSWAVEQDLRTLAVELVDQRWAGEVPVD
jgi:hypothetical protein